MIQQSALAAQKGNCSLSCSSVASRSKDIILSLYWAPVRPHLGSICSSGDNDKSNMALLEWIQKGPQRWLESWSTSPVKPGCETWGYSAWRRKRKLWGDLTAAFQYLQGTYRRGLLIRAWGDRTRGNSFELKEGRFRLDIKKKFFIVSTVKHGNRFPREDVDAPSLEGFKPMAGGLGPDNL